ncbi:MAG: hypothetical protein FI675_03720 [SAR202 cluster bacterium]|nr:hypothetical protein [SAR202 cluster bacterium]|tara:strand:+ start:7394 stop:8056 length:663 start_codon:yes stop_codon:yes gene_type:complete
MPKVNTYLYPEYSLQGSLDIIRNIYDNFAGEVSRAGLASIMSMSERGGAFTDRLASFKIWNLLEGKSKLKITSYGINIINSYSPDLLIKDIVLGVPLFNEIATRVDRLGGHYTKEQIKIIICDITGSSIDDHDKKLNHIYTIFHQISRYVCSKNNLENSNHSKTDAKKLKIQFDDFVIESELNISNIDTALVSLWSKRSELEINSSKSQPSPLEILIRNK